MAHKIDGFLDADDRTLRLSVPELSPEQIQQFLRYEQAFLGHAEAGHPDDARLAEAHQRGLDASGLTAESVSRLSTLVRAYAGAVCVIRRVELRMSEARLASEQGDEAAREKLARLQGEHARLASMHSLQSRIGPATIALLEANRDVLVDGHERVAKILAEPRT